ncbi:hypothetical protein IV203_010753 [Nitzschia inconspicua]|uniref:Uncharacterized protein n=1 Tax=Nitzschia inconspicua TaxID=303405 RepID=A0A9K3KY57_9STRA|nr:hypothetical protein IV203_010753 [Nitzschia inconspicua]
MPFPNSSRPFFYHHITFQGLLLLTVIVGTVFAADSKPQDDFDGYMQQKLRQEAEDAEYQLKLARHEEWRQNTWGGWAVRSIQDLAQHIKPFALAVADAMKDDETGNSLSPTKLLVYVGLRVYVVLMFLLLIFALSRLVQMFVGTGDIVMEEEVVIVHEYDTEEEAAKARAAQTRGKKQKSQ